MRESSGQDVGIVGPRFCHRCDRPGLSRRDLCDECGERLRAQGFCPICESYWRKDVGADCPKHEVELEAAPPRPEPFGRPGERPTLVTVATYSHANQANGPRIRLEGEGIPTFLDGERIAASYHLATGGVRLLVPAEHASAARILIAQTWAPSPEIDGVADEDWDEADFAPEPGTRRRAVMKLAILLVLIGPGLIVAIQWIREVAQSFGLF